MMNQKTDISMAEMAGLIQTAFRFSSEESRDLVDEFVFFLEEEETMVWHRPQGNETRDI